MFCALRASHRGVVAAVLVIAAACTGDDSTGLPKEGTKLTTPSAIAVSPRADTLGVGQSRRLAALVTDASGSPREAALAWRSISPTIASVSASGDVTALSPGLASIIVAAGALSDTASIVVRAQDLIVEPNAISIAVGEQVRLVAVRPNGSAVPYGSVTTWASSDEAVAVVASDGTVSAVGQGDVTLMAAVDGKQGSAVMSVRSKDIASLRITPMTSSIYPGARQQLSAVAYDDAGRQMTLDASSVRWSASDSRIATVDDHGLTSGVTRGAAVITARLANKQATASVNVLASPAATIAVSLAASTLEIGQTTQATADVVDAAGASINSPTLAWQSSNPAIVTVDAGGTVTAIARGAATISAISDGKTGDAPLTVAAKSVTSVAVSPGAAAALQGQSVQLTAAAKDAQGNVLPGKTITWQSANPAVATVSGSGLVTSVGPGSTTISATAEGVSGSSTFATTQQAVANLSVSPPSSSMTAGQNVQLVATATDANGNVLSSRVPAWSSSNPTVATVSSNGKVTAVGRGSVSISATVDAKVASAAIAVNDPPPVPVATVTVTLNASALTIGQSTQAVAVLRDANGNVLSGRTVTWTSEAPALATISGNGLVAAIAAGSATITASSEGRTGTATLVIQPGTPATVASVSLSATSTSMFAGQSQAVSVTLRDAAGNTLGGRTITWSSSNLAVVTVAPGGTVTAVGAGTATVTATSEGKTGSINFTVSATTAIAPVATVSLSSSATTLAVGQTSPTTATLKDAHGTALTGRTVTWSSSAPNVASVSSTGVVTGVAGGTAVISASSEGITGSIAFTVTSPGGAATVTVTLSSGALTVGQSTQAVAVARDASGTTLGGTAAWSSSNTAVATVSGSGLVTAVGAGTASINASMAGTQGSSAVAVTTPGGTGVTPAAAELPRSTPSVTVPAPSGRTIRVAAGGDLQAALNSAQPGDVVALAPGATFTGNFVLPTKACNGWITLRTDIPDGNLPAAGQRITPAYAGQLAKLVTPDNQPALKTVNPTCQWRLLGLEVTGTLPMTSLQYGLVWLGDGGYTGGGEVQTSLDRVPADLVLDRVYIHGTPTLNVFRCLSVNSARTAVVNSWLSECHAKGFDSQAIAGWNGPGPYLIENNTLEGAGENVMFGGADAAISNLSPSDITFRRNHVRKPPEWKGVWTVKNLLELKHAKRVLMEGNVFENNWADAQTGMAIVLKSTNQGGTNPWAQTADVTFRYNVVRNSPQGFNIAAAPDQYTAAMAAVPAARFRVEHNLFENIGSYNGTTNGNMLVLMNNLSDVVISHNTMHFNYSEGLLATMEAWGAARNIVIDDNVVTKGRYYALMHSGFKVGIESMNAFAGSTWSFARNVVIGVDSEYVSYHPQSSWYPTTMAQAGFATGANGDYRLSGSSPYKGRASDGTDPGANFDELNRRIAGVVVQ